MKFDFFAYFCGMNGQFEIIEFTWAGLKLQEPMALLTNWIITCFCLFAYIKIKWSDSYSSRLFRYFFLFLAISTFLGGLGHLFFQYFGVPGKFPSWITAVTAGYLIGKGVLHYWRSLPGYKFLNNFLLFKSLSLIILSLLTQKFLFVAIDAILTYLLYCGYIAWKLWMNDKIEMKYFVFGIIVLLPSSFIFLMNINLHRYLNRDDLSHILMLLCIIFFYFGVKKNNFNYLDQES